MYTSATIDWKGEKVTINRNEDGECPCEYEPVDGWGCAEGCFVRCQKE